MENFVVSARKYRPQKFEDVVGQESITRTLENAIKNNHLAQAFLFCGPRGVGKTTCARILAKTINAESMGEDFKEDEDFSFNIFELDAASNNSVEDIRSLTEQVRFAPQIGSYKVYIIDEVHMLSQAAFNAFLKTLEEPPSYAIFILATTEKHKIIPTILSRCQIFDFKRIEVKDIVAHLRSIAEEENVQIEDAALHIIGQKADGALRDALSIFDQVVSFSGNNITYQNVIENLNVLDYDYYFGITNAMFSGDYATALVTLNEVLYKGFDGHNFINGLASHFRDLLMCRNKATLGLLEVADEIKNKYHQQAQTVSEEFLLTSLQLCNDCDINYRMAKNQRLLIEYTLIAISGITGNSVQKKNSNHEVILPPSPAKALAKADDLAKGSRNAIYSYKPSIKDHKLSEPQKSSEPQINQPRQEQKQTSNLSDEAKADLKPQTSNLEPNSPSPKPTSLFGYKSKSSITSQLEENNVQIPNLKEGENEKEDNTPKGPTQDFSLDDLKNAWEKYSKQMAENNDKGFFYSSFSNLEFELKNKTDVHFMLQSATEEKEWKQRKPDALAFLRAAINNYALDFVWKVKKKDAKLKYYTNKDRFKRMAELNPQLIELKKRLNLELE